MRRATGRAPRGRARATLEWRDAASLAPAPPGPCAGSAEPRRRPPGPPARTPPTRARPRPRRPPALPGPSPPPPPAPPPPRRLGPVAGDVADRQREPAGAEDGGVVPVAAHRGTVARGQVAHGDLAAAQRRDCLRQEPRLERRSRSAVALVRGRVRECARAP